MKAIIYLRTSTKDQHPEDQLKDCEALAKKKGLIDYEVIIERASAWKADARSEYNQLVERLRKGTISSLIVWHYDRLSRNYKQFLELMMELYLIHNVRVYCVQQQWLDDLYQITEAEWVKKIPEPWGGFIKDSLKQTWKLLVKIVGKTNEDESNKKSQRIKKRFNSMSKRERAKWGRPKLSIYLEQKVLELHKQGLSKNQIAEKVKCSYGSVFNIIKKHTPQNQALNQPKNEESIKD